MCNRFRIFASFPALFFRFAGVLFAFFPAALSAADPFAAGDALDAVGRHAEALAVFQEAETRTPDNAELLHRLAKQYDQLAASASADAEKKRLGELSLDAAQRAVKADPKNSNAHLALAVAHGRIALTAAPRRKVELSKLIKEEAELAAKLDAKNDIAWFILGRWNYEMTNFSPFLKGLAQMIYGKFPAASNETAAVCFEKAIAAGPPRVANHVEYGRTLIALGKKNEARKQLEKGLSLPAKTKDDEETKQRARQALQEL